MFIPFRSQDTSKITPAPLRLSECNWVLPPPPSRAIYNHIIVIIQLLLSGGSTQHIHPVCHVRWKDLVNFGTARISRTYILTTLGLYKDMGKDL